MLSFDEPVILWKRPIIINVFNLSHQSFIAAWTMPVSFAKQWAFSIITFNYNFRRNAHSHQILEAKHFSPTKTRIASPLEGGQKNKLVHSCFEQETKSKKWTKTFKESLELFLDVVLCCCFLLSLLLFLRSTRYCGAFSRRCISNALLASLRAITACDVSGKKYSLYSSVNSHCQ